MPVKKPGNDLMSSIVVLIAILLASVMIPDLLFMEDRMLDYMDISLEKRINTDGEGRTPSLLSQLMPLLLFWSIVKLH